MLPPSDSLQSKAIDRLLRDDEDKLASEVKVGRCASALLRSRPWTCANMLPPSDSLQQSQSGETIGPTEQQHLQMAATLLTSTRKLSQKQMKVIPGGD
jgi:hypothetical protein